ncbi:MAG: NAD-dependent epimerase/dehydratase family protein [Chthoniobacterales bacterium]|nr:NAD-dependent epimerase/dehydratase family protein [Chthoniobacterales bacterium]
MKIFISGVCGFVGSELALGLREAGHEVCGCDNFSRPGSELNKPRIESAGVDFSHGDVRREEALERFRGIDWVIDAAANPSVLAGVDGRTSSRELLEHNLWGTVNLLELCKRESAGMVLLSTSRVYSIGALCSLPVKVSDGAFVLDERGDAAGPRGVTEEFSTDAPVSLYGASKLASEQIALEYGSTFGFPVWVNRCGVMSGAGQFGRPDQGIFSFWIHSWARRAPLKYIGFGGTGHQVRDCLHPRDLLGLVVLQIGRAGASRDGRAKPRVVNVGGGADSAMSLRQLSEWCEKEFGPGTVAADLTPRPFDLPWVVLDASKAEDVWGWRPGISTARICAEIAEHAREHPEWLRISAG